MAAGREQEATAGSGAGFDGGQATGECAPRGDEATARGLAHGGAKEAAGDQRQRI